MSRFCHTTTAHTIAAAASNNPPGVYVTTDGHTAFVHLAAGRIVVSRNAVCPGRSREGDAVAAQVAARAAS
jgi:hypothetical protein